MRNEILKILERLGVYNIANREMLANRVMHILEIGSLTIEQIQDFISKLDFTTARYKASYFVQCLSIAVKNGEFKTETAVKAHPVLSSIEDFEKEWDTWCDVIRGLSLNPEMSDSPSFGVLVCDTGNLVRGVSTGDGSFVYIDGTESQRFKKFEDLDIQEKKDLIAAVERLHRSLTGTKEVVLKMESLIGGHEDVQNR